MSAARKGAIAKFAKADTRPRCVLITGSQGSGKTREVIHAVAAIEGDVVVRMTEPTHAKADEVARDYRAIATANSMAVLVVRGRSADDPAADNAKVCRRHKIAEDAAKQGVNVRKAICSSCPFGHAVPCGQDAEIAAMGNCGLFLMPREYLYLPCPAPPADILIVDEGSTPAASMASRCGTKVWVPSDLDTRT